MGLCTRRHFVLTICILQLISTIERQVFDFLGTLWGPILANFFQTIFVIFGFFGTHQFRPRYVIAYSVWSTIWIGWNIFIICFYMNIGLDKNGSALNFGTDGVSWWALNGFGCRQVLPTNITEDPFSGYLRPESVVGCLLRYEYVEVLHASIQIVLSVLGVCGGIYVLQIFVEEDDSFDFLGGLDTKSPQHLALRPTYVRVPTHSSQSFLRSSQLRLAGSRQDSLGQPRAMSLPRDSDPLRMCRSDLYVNKAGMAGSEDQKNFPFEDSRMLPLQQFRHLKPRPLSVHVTRFD